MRRAIAAFLIFLLCASALGQLLGQRATVSSALNYTALRPGQQAVIAVVVDIASGFHAQSNKPLADNLIPLKVELETNPNVQFSAPVYPAGSLETYPALGTMSVYSGTVIVHVPIQVASTVAPDQPLELKGKVTFQICDDRVCYAPETRNIAISVPIVGPDGKAEPANAELFRDFKPQVTAAKEPKRSWSVLQAFGAALIAGLLFNVMPCVLPVLPLKAIGFYEVSQHRRSRAILLGLVFSAGIISVFAALSLIVLVFRLVAWGDLFSYGWFIWSITLVLIALGSGLLGGWDLALPLGIYTFEPRHDTLSGNYFWGALTAILATPCTAPLLPPVLLWASQKPTGIGVPAVIMVGVGMSLPYLILSAVPELARRFPQTGPWSELFKQMMGFLLLAAAAFFGAGRIIHGLEFWWVVTAVVAVASVYLVARSVQLSKNSLPVGVCSTVAVLMLGIMLAWTARITGLTTPASSTGSTADRWTAYSDEAFAQLRASGKPVLVKFTANWCATCQVIEGTVFQSPKVWQTLESKGVAAVKVDLSSPDAPGKSLLLSLNPTGGIPLTAIWLPGSDQPVLLESIYSTSDLLAALADMPTTQPR